MRRSLVPVALAALLAGAAALAVSCISTDTYVYTAQKYDPASACLEAYAPVETVAGEGASALCAPSCLAVGAALYVSTMCPPLPAIATEVAADASDCIEALAAPSCDAPEPGADASQEDDASDPDAEPVEGGDTDADVDATIADAGDAG
ncbi:MAG: hypothetical protein KF819_36400 [Labilithrix sp.]|nr:hypothetical protein [Labilithrix sp.]